MAKVSLRAVGYGNWTIKYAKRQTENMCLEAVKQCEYAIEFIQDPDTREKIKERIEELYYEQNSN